MKLVLQIYGSTEVKSSYTRDHSMFSRCTINNDQANLIAGALEIMSGYLGRLTTGNSAYIRDVETGARLGPGEVGEICVKTMICMKVKLESNLSVAS